VKLDADIAAYEGLIFSTAARYAPLLDDDLEDVQQVLRVKVWQALRVYDPSRSRATEKSYVFSCVRNQVKDLLKAQSRRNEARNGSQSYVEDVSDEHRPRFEARYLSQTAEQVFALVEDQPVLLPSTLTATEAQVVELLLLDFSRTEIAKTLGVSRDKVTALHASVQEKMADWHPGHRVERSRQPIAA
jgi:RNA polymerase sigma factor (sigma-70 family)